MASLVIGTQPAMAMKSVPFCLTCVVTDIVLEYSVEVKAEIVMIE